MHNNIFYQVNTLGKEHSKYIRLHIYKTLKYKSPFLETPCPCDEIIQLQKIKKISSRQTFFYY